MHIEMLLVIYGCMDVRSPLRQSALSSEEVASIKRASLIFIKKA